MNRLPAIPPKGGAARPKAEAAAAAPPPPPPRFVKAVRATTPGMVLAVGSPLVVPHGMMHTYPAAGGVRRAKKKKSLQYAQRDASQADKYRVYSAKEEIRFGGFDKRPDRCPLVKGALYNPTHDISCGVCRADKRARVTHRRSAIREQEFAFRMEILQEEGLRRSHLEHVGEEERIDVEVRMRRRLAYEERLAEWEAAREGARNEVLSYERYSRAVIDRAEGEAWQEFAVQQREWSRQTQHLVRQIRACERESAERKDRLHREMLERREKERQEYENRRFRSFLKEEEAGRRLIAGSEEHSRGVLHKLMKTITQRLELAQILLKQRQAERDKHSIAAVRAMEGDEAALRAEFMALHAQMLEEARHEEVRGRRVIEAALKQRRQDEQATRNGVAEEETQGRRGLDAEAFEIFHHLAVAEQRSRDRLLLLARRRAWRRDVEARELVRMTQEDFRCSQLERKRQRAEERRAQQAAAAAREAAEVAERERVREHHSYFGGLYADEQFSRTRIEGAEASERMSMGMLFDEGAAELAPDFARMRKLLKREAAKRAAVMVEEEAGWAEVMGYYVDVIADLQEDAVREAAVHELQAELAEVEGAPRPQRRASRRSTNASGGDVPREDAPFSEGAAAVEVDLEALDAPTDDEEDEDAAVLDAPAPEEPPPADAPPPPKVMLGYTSAWLHDGGAVALFPTAAAEGEALEKVTVNVEISKGLAPKDELSFRSDVWAFEKDGFYNAKGEKQAPIIQSHGKLRAEFSAEETAVTAAVVQDVLQAVCYNCSDPNPPKAGGQFHRVVHVTVTLKTKGVLLPMQLDKTVALHTWPQLLAPVPSAAPVWVNGDAAVLLNLKKSQHLARGLFEHPTMPFPQNHRARLSVRYEALAPYERVVHDTLNVLDKDKANPHFDKYDSLSLLSRISAPIEHRDGILLLRRGTAITKIKEGKLEPDGNDESVVLSFPKPDTMNINELLNAFVYRRSEPHGAAFMRVVHFTLSVLRKTRVVASSSVAVVVDIHNAAKGALLMSPRPASDYRLGWSNNLTSVMEPHVLTPQVLLFPNARLRTTLTGTVERGSITITGLGRHDSVAFRANTTFKAKPMGESAEENDALVALGNTVAAPSAPSDPVSMGADEEGEGTDDVSTYPVMSVMGRDRELKALVVRDRNAVAVKFVSGRVTPELVAAFVANVLFVCVPRRRWKVQLGTRELQLTIDLGRHISEHVKVLSLATAVTVAPPIFNIAAAQTYKEGSGAMSLARSVDWIGQGNSDDLGNGAFFEATIAVGAEAEDMLSFKGLPLEVGGAPVDVIWDGELLGAATLFDGGHTLRVEFFAKEAQRTVYSMDPENSDVYENPQQSVRCSVGGWVTRIDPHVRYILKNMLYTHTGKDPTEMDKLVRFVVCDGTRGLSAGFAELNVVPVHDMTEVAVERTTFKYRPAIGGAVLLLFPEVQVSDPDTDNFQKGFVHLDIISGGDNFDAVEFLSLRQQEQRYLDAGDIDGEPGAAVGAYEDPSVGVGHLDPEEIDASLRSDVLWLLYEGGALYVNNVYVAAVTTKGSGVKGTCPTSWQLDFHCNYPVPLNVVRHVLSCMYYETTAAKVQPGRRVLRLRLNAMDSTPPPPDTRLRLEVEVFPPHLSCPAYTQSWKYPEKGGVRPINGHIVTHLPKSELVPSGSSVTCEMQDAGDPADKVCFLPAGGDGGFVETGACELMYTRGKTEVLVGMVSERDDLKIVVECSEFCTGSLLGKLVTAFGYENTSVDPVPGTRRVEVAYYEPAEVPITEVGGKRRSLAPMKEARATADARRLSVGGQRRFSRASARASPAPLPSEAASSVVEVEVAVVPEDDPTEITLKEDKRPYILTTAPLHFAAGCVVTDPDTSCFDGAPPAHGITVSFLAAPSMTDSLNVIPAAGSDLTVEELDGEVMLCYKKRTCGSLPSGRTFGPGKSQLRVAFKQTSLEALQEIVRSLTYQNKGTSQRDIGNKSICIKLQDEQAKGPSKAVVGLENVIPLLDVSGCRPAVHFLSHVRLSLPSLNFVTLKITCRAVAVDGGSEGDLPWPEEMELQSSLTQVFKVKNETELHHGMPVKQVGTVARSATTLEIAFQRCPRIEPALLQTLVRSCSFRLPPPDAPPPPSVRIDLSASMQMFNSAATQAESILLDGDWWGGDEPAGMGDRRNSGFSRTSSVGSASGMGGRRSPLQRGKASPGVRPVATPR